MELEEACAYADEQGHHLPPWVEGLTPEPLSATRQGRAPPGGPGPGLLFWGKLEHCRLGLSYLVSALVAGPPILSAAKET